MIVKNKQPEVILSFYDDPSSYLPEILSILREERVQGVFFWQTRLIHAKKTAWKPLLEEGHFLGSHAHSHQMLTKLSYEEQYLEMKLNKEILEILTGQPIPLFRPPHGLYNEDTMEVIRKLGYKIVLWRVSSWDWKHKDDEEMILENVLKHVSPGDIVLLHELPQTVKILPALIQDIRDKGLKLFLPHTALKWDHRLCKS